MKKRSLLLVAVILLVAVVVFFAFRNTNCRFRVMTNFDGVHTVCLDMDLENAILDGIYIPSARQTKDGSGMFDFSFTAPKKGKYYKIYYQNESYKFPDTSALASENFYGSWEEVSIGFKPITTRKVKDQLRIVGNPRDEAIYEGDRWKRNPRVGNYQFMLVVCDEEGLAEIPDYVQHIGATDAEGRWVNPFGWFETHPSKHIKICSSKRLLKARVVLDARYGIYVNDSEADSSKDCDCGNSQNLYEHALYEQVYSHASQQFTLRNIPVIKDVVGDDPYTLAE